MRMSDTPLALNLGGGKRKSELRRSRPRSPTAEHRRRCPFPARLWAGRRVKYEVRMPDENDDIEWVFLASTPRDQAEVDRLQAEVKRLKEQVRRLKAALSR
jgi:hypothetical protein